MRTIRHPLFISALSLSTLTLACGEAPTETSVDDTLIETTALAIENFERQDLSLEEGADVCSIERITQRGQRDQEGQRQGDMRRGPHGEGEGMDADDLQERHPPRDRADGANRERPEAGPHARPQRDRSRGSARGGLRAMIRRGYDLDQDGSLNEEERGLLRDDLVTGCQARHARLLERHDQDGDGALSASERESAQVEREARRAEAQGAREAHRDAHREALIEAYDADGDGALSREERERARSTQRAEREARLELFESEFDLDEDGVLSAEEEAELRAHIQERVRRGARPHHQDPSERGAPAEEERGEE